MKKIFLIFVCAVLVFTSQGCTQNNKNSTEEKITQNEVKAPGVTQKYETFTGLKPLPKISLTVKDPENSENLPTVKIEHSFGIAKNGVIHDISVQSQKFFEAKKYNAVTYDSSGEKSLYLTFDCGYENGNTEKVLDVLKAKKVPAAFFCTLYDISSSPELIARIIAEGHIVGNHSDSHRSFAEIDRKAMAKEIENCDNYLREKFGYTSPYFRFPKGEYTESALEAVNSLGYKCVFWSLAYNDWDTDSQKGGDYAFQKVTERLHPGAIILLHSVSSDNAEALGKIIDYAREQGYTFKAISDL